MFEHNWSFCPELVIPFEWKALHSSGPRENKNVKGKKQGCPDIKLPKTRYEWNSPVAWVALSRNPD